MHNIKKMTFLYGKKRVHIQVNEMTENMKEFKKAKLGESFPPADDVHFTFDTDEPYNPEPQP